LKGFIILNETFDIVIVGNGAIGTYTAVDIILKYPNLKIAIIGLEARSDSASAAAGAMCNVFAETEQANTKLAKETFQKYLYLGIRGAKGWSDFLERISPNSIVTTKDTLVFLKKSANSFEQSNFKEMIRIAQAYSVYEDYPITKFTEALPLTKNRIESVAKIKGEFAMDSSNLLRTLDKLLHENHVTFINKKVDAVIPGIPVVIKTASNDFYADKVVLSAGSNTGNLLQDTPIVPMLQGVGSAYLFSSIKREFPNIFSKNVIRTVNRGGAQCGFHVVPRNQGFYLGAGNYISQPSESSHRLETLRYLFQTLETELIGKEFSYELSGSLVKGHRPRSMDGLPMIGELGESPNIFIATGTNRAGLTWAPSISREILNWIAGDPIDDMFNDWKPDRKMRSFGDSEEALSYFIESRIGAALEHELISNDSYSIAQHQLKLRTIGINLLHEVRSRFNEETFTLHPDHWSAILDSSYTCTYG
jgi:glycine/D-amino acid oxidase-like deaminating enzyme